MYIYDIYIRNFKKTENNDFGIAYYFNDGCSKEWRDSTFNVCWFTPPSNHSHTHITKLISKGKIHENCFSQLSLFHFNGEQTWHLANQHFKQTDHSRSIIVFHAKFWISNTGKAFLPFIRLMSQIRKILSVTHQHSSRRVDNCISSHKMKQDEKHHLILFLMDVPKQQFAHLLKIMTKLSSRSFIVQCRECAPSQKQIQVSCQSTNTSYDQKINTVSKKTKLLLKIKNILPIFFSSLQPLCLVNW